MSDEVKTLDKFGTQFQRKSIATLLNDKTFLHQMRDILKPKFYDRKSLRWICERVLDYWDEYRKPPTLDYFKTQVKQGIENNGAMEADVIQQLKYIWRAREDDDLEWVKDEFHEFAHNQRLRSAILKSTELLDRGQYDAIKDEVDQAMNAGLSKDLGHVYTEDVDERLKEDPRDSVATGWDVLNDKMDGGLAGGELGTVVAPSGAGKSWFLTAIGHACMKQGGLVAHYTMELDDNYTARRYDSISTGRTPNEIPDHREEIKRITENEKGDAVIVRWPEKSVSAQSIHAHVERLTALRRKPDLIVVDYADCLAARRSKRGEGSYEAQGSVYVDLRRVGGELDIPVWTASQTNRKGEQTEVITADLIAESYKKVMKADFVASLSRTREDKLTNDARLHLIKNRMGPDGETLPAKMDLSCGHIEIFEPGSEDARMSEVERKLHKQSEESKKMGQLYESFKKHGTVPTQ
jgi:replicative DNA helicase